jgi:phosphoglycolate phosphatase
MRRIVIFDLDGTLIDSRADLASAGNHSRVAVGLPALPEASVLGFVGDGLDRLIERLVPTVADRGQAMAAFSAYYLAHCCDHTKPYAGIVELLTQLRERQWMMAVATNKPLVFTTAILSGCGITNYFSAVRGGDGPRKPDPQQLTDIMTTLGAKANDCWMIGDHHTDIHAGRAAGCRVAFCTWGIGQMDALSVDVELHHPSEFMVVVNQ